MWAIFIVPSLLLFCHCRKIMDPEETIVDIGNLPSEMKYDERIKLNYDHRKDKIKWSSSDPFVAIIDENGYLKGQHIGSTIISGKGKDINVEKELTITPYVKGIREPFVHFGKSIDRIKILMKIKPVEEDFSALYYANTSEQSQYLYYWFNSSNQLFLSGIIFGEQDDKLLKTAQTFFAERYHVMKEKNKRTYYLDSKRTFFVVLDINADRQLVAFYKPIKEEDNK